MSAQLALRAADGATVTLERFPIVLGRTTPAGGVPDVDVTHLDPQGRVAARHCELYPEAEGVRVRDLDTANGTWIDGRRLPSGGSGVLPVGGTLRVASVELTLVPAPSRRPAPPAAIPRDPTDWRDSFVAGEVPPPPSSRSGELSLVAEPGLDWAPDLTGAPPVARVHLEQGASSVRIVAGAPLTVHRAGSTTSQGPPLSASDVEELQVAARAVLGLGEDASSGWGYVGDLAIDFAAAPPARRATMGVTSVPPPTITDGIRRAVGDWVAAGGAALFAGRNPGRVLRDFAESLRRCGLRPWLLADTDEPGFPGGWGELSPADEASMAIAMAADPLVMAGVADSELATVLRALPRLAGGTVIAVEAASPEAALDRCCRLLGAEGSGEPTQLARQREEVVRRLPRVLSWEPGGQTRWRSVQVRTGDSSWSITEFEGS